MKRHHADMGGVGWSTQTVWNRRGRLRSHLQWGDEMDDQETPEQVRERLAKLVMVPVPDDGDFCAIWDYWASYYYADAQCRKALREP